MPWPRPCDGTDHQMTEHMRHHHLALLLLSLIATSATAQKWGLGVRLGDPSGISVKKYGEGHAWEFNLGRTHLFNGHRYFNNRYAYWYDHQHFDHKEHEFIGYSASVPLGLQVHYLFQKPVKNAEGLQWYWGFGGQVRTQRVSYAYRYKVKNGPDWVVVNDASVQETNLGLDGVLGLEYKFKNAPLAMFLDGTLFMELYDQPFLFSLQGGLGVRYTF